ncbi:MAG: hypothetical protein EZS28_013903 [Streblomastix strix]|uniref:Reverse transcriptase domain-containing protein n=1 Tax=Streblomastix strix TaxID=222440 RepID=A0A5J4W6J7_9EUKA|nr:MAG: hypothetical protein EZS28_013903 [Streblomastix strix]
MQKDPPDNHSDRESTWTEDEAPQHQSIIDTSTAQTASPISDTEVEREIQQQSNQDDIEEQEVIQERIAALQIEKEQLGISDSDIEWQQVTEAIDNNNNLTPRSAQKQLQEKIQQSVPNYTTKQQQQTTDSNTQLRIISPLPRMIITGMNKDKPTIQSQQSVTPIQKPQHRSGMRQRLKKAERELELLKAQQQLQQQENNDLNNIYVEMPDIQGTVVRLTGLQPSPSAAGPGLNAGLKPVEVGLILASNMERTEPQISEGHDDNADEEEDEQTDEAALNQNKDYRVNAISQLLVQENLGTQSQDIQGLNALNQMEKDDSGPTPVGVQEKPKKGKGSKKVKTEGLNAPAEQNQGSNAQDQTNTASKVPKTKATSKKMRRGVGSLIGQGHPNQGRSAQRSPFGIEKRSALMITASQKRKERIGELIYKENINGMGGKTKRFKQIWEQIGKEEFINTGFYLRFKDYNSQQRLEENRMIISFKGTYEEKKAYQEMLREELEEGIVEPIQQDQVKWWNPTFLIKKPNETWRKILDASKLNKEIEKLHFKMHRLEEVQYLANQMDYATSLDLKAAFHQITVSPNSIPYLAFNFNNNNYTYKAMPFGTKHSPIFFAEAIESIL